MLSVLDFFFGVLAFKSTGVYLRVIGLLEARKNTTTLLIGIGCVLSVFFD